MTIPLKPKLALWKFASCDGCQLSLLNLEDDLLNVAEHLDIAYFPEGFRQETRGPYDISLVEGSITTPHDAERIHRIRRMSRILIAMGACATSGGIQALRNFASVDGFTRLVYPKPQMINALNKSTPISDHTHVDYEIHGCPVNKFHIIETLLAILNGRRPNIPAYSLCVECKRLGIVCVMVTGKEPCMGPVTRAGCGALCPSFSRGCYGCFGPKETPNTAALSDIWKRRFQMKDPDIVLAFRRFTSGAEPFRKESEIHET
ncbi:MAG: oxidoreductase [Pseudomonadota bacterium]